MLIALILLSVLLLAAIAGLAVLALRSTLTPGPTLSGRTVVIHTRKPDDQTLKGVLHAQHADRWVLRDAYLITSLGENAAGGLQHIPVANIAWAQEIEA